MGMSFQKKKITAPGAALEDDHTHKHSTTLLDCPTTQDSISIVETPNDNSLETVQADIIPENDLPPGIEYDIKEWFTDLATQYNIELDKCSNIQWRGVCLMIGDRIKAAGFLIDREKQKVRGGKPYKPERVAALVPIWERFTALYKHIPMAVDFIAFSGVSTEWFYDTQNRGLSSARVELTKRVKNIEESALSVALTDHRENPTGRIYYTKARLGWQETSTVVHVSSAPAPVIDSVPDLARLGDGSGSEIP